MTDGTIQVAMDRLAEAIRRLPDGAPERQVRTSFLKVLERLRASDALHAEDWDIGAWHQDVRLWRLSSGGQKMTAVLRFIDDYGYEVRLLAGNDLRHARMFQWDRDAALDYARERGAALQALGWR